jgi:hypothetical protein
VKKLTLDRHAFETSHAQILWKAHDRCSPEELGHPLALLGVVDFAKRQVGQDRKLHITAYSWQQGLGANGVKPGINQVRMIGLRNERCKLKNRFCAAIGACWEVGIAGGARSCEIQNRVTG